MGVAGEGIGQITLPVPTGTGLPLLLRTHLHYTEVHGCMQAPMYLRMCEDPTHAASCYNMLFHIYLVWKMLSFPVFLIYQTLTRLGQHLAGKQEGEEGGGDEQMPEL